MGSMKIEMLHTIDVEVLHTTDMAHVRAEDYEGEEQPARQRYASQELDRFLKVQNHGS